MLLEICSMQLPSSVGALVLERRGGLGVLSPVGEKGCGGVGEEDGVEDAVGGLGHGGRRQIRKHQEGSQGWQSY